MNNLGRVVLLAMIPLNLVLLAWVWLGRIVFGVAGWFLLILLVSVVPVVLVALLVTTILAFARGQRPRRLTTAQAWAQLAVWAGMLGFGFFVVDFGDVEGSDLSAFTQVVGRNDASLSISWTMTGISMLVTIGAWVVLLVLLIAQRREAATSTYGAVGTG